jgi:tRNA(Arg) A34 adenosine deaminase TadA
MVTQNGHWLSLEEPWRIALTLAWEAYVGGSIAVGAVLTDPQGRVVAVGRNRVSDKEAPPGRLRSTFIAHAELDVLGQLKPSDYRRHTLWTTLEPCPLSVPWPLSRATSGVLPLQQEIGFGTEYLGSRS